MNNLTFQALTIKICIHFKLQNNLQILVMLMNLVKI